MPARAVKKEFDKMVIWFFGSLVAGVLPFAARIITHEVCNDYPTYDIKDAVFLGLAMNISNLNLLNDKAIPNKLVLFFASTFILFFLAFILAAFQISECQNPKFEAKLSTVLGVISLTFVSVFLSFIANSISAKYLKFPQWLL